MAFGYFKDLIKRSQSNIILRGKAFKIASNLKCDGYTNCLIKNLVELVSLSH